MNDHAATTALTMDQRADALEEQMTRELEHIVTKSVLFNLADGKVGMESGPALMAKNPGKYMLMGEDPRLPKMPAKPTLIDYFRCRFASSAHLLQSAPPMRCAPASTRRSCSPACCTISASLASSAPIMATGARSSSSPMWTRR
jgi:hypothetical protein